MTPRPVILFVDDSDEDYLTAVRLLRRQGVNAPEVRRCADGEEALDYLSNCGSDAQPRPAVVLLDLNMPGSDGREVLAQLKADERLRMLPVVVLTTSSSPHDIAVCYNLGASGYIVKPVDLERFAEVLANFCTYWFHTVALPPS